VSAAGIKRDLEARGQHDVNALVLAGDGGTYDIGLQSLSGAAERNEDIVEIMAAHGIPYVATARPRISLG